VELSADPVGDDVGRVGPDAGDQCRPVVVGHIARYFSRGLDAHCLNNSAATMSDGDATKSSVFKTASMPQLNGCSCSAAGLHIRKGFVDKAAGVPQLICNLTDRAALRSQSGNPSGIHGHTWPA
jgi:hypothetical protein